MKTKFVNSQNSYNLLFKAIHTKRHQLQASLIIIISFTAILSFLLYYAESQVQPDKFPSYLTALAWSFSKFINDIGGYGNNLPITIIGKLIATLIGVLSIVIVALPAGIIASGFVEVMDERVKENELNKKYDILKDQFKRKGDLKLSTHKFTGPKTFIELENMMLLKDENSHIHKNIKSYEFLGILLNNEEIFKLITSKQGLRYITKKADDEILYSAIEYFEPNRIYGTCYEGIYNKYNSKTNKYEGIKAILGKTIIIAPVNYRKANLGYFAYKFAENTFSKYISNELYNFKEINENSKFDFYENPYLEQFSKSDSNIPYYYLCFLNDILKNVTKDDYVFILCDDENHNDFEIFKGEKINFINSHTVSNIKGIDKIIYEYNNYNGKDFSIQFFNDYEPNLQESKFNLRSFIFQNTKATVTTITISDCILESKLFETTLNLLTLPIAKYCSFNYSDQKEQNEIKKNEILNYLVNNNFVISEDLFFLLSRIVSDSGLNDSELVVKFIFENVEKINKTKGKNHLLFQELLEKHNDKDYILKLYELSNNNWNEHNINKFLDYFMNYRPEIFIYSGENYFDKFYELFLNKNDDFSSLAGLILGNSQDEVFLRYRFNNEAELWLRLVSLVKYEKEIIKIFETIKITSHLKTNYKLLSLVFNKYIEVLDNHNNIMEFYNYCFEEKLQLGFIIECIIKSLEFSINIEIIENILDLMLDNEYDIEVFKQNIINYEKNVISLEHHLIFSNIISEKYNDKQFALEIIKKAELLTNKSTDLCNIALNVFCLIDFMEYCLALFDKAEKLANCSEDYINISISYYESICDIEHSFEIFKKAVDLTFDSLEFRELAILVIEKFNNYEFAIDIIRKAELSSEKSDYDCIGMLGLSYFVFDKLEDYEYSQILFAKAEVVAQFSLEYISLAEYIYKKENNIEKVKELIKIAESKEQSFDSLIGLAELYINIFEDFEKGNEYYNIAISKAEKPEHYNTFIDSIKENNENYELDFNYYILSCSNANDFVNMSKKFFEIDEERSTELIIKALEIAEIECIDLKHYLDIVDFLASNDLNNSKELAMIYYEKALQSCKSIEAVEYIDRARALFIQNIINPDLGWYDILNQKTEILSSN